MISGNLGSGKTATMVWLAQKRKLKGQKIMSNITTTFTDDTDITAPAEILLMHRHKNCCILIDELWTLIDSRSSTTGENKFLNDIVLSSRKRGVTIMGTSQMPGMVDKRYRDIADYTVICERRGPDNSLNSTIKAHITKPDFRAKQSIIVKTYSFKVRDVADLYDTNEIIEQDRRLYIIEMAKLLREKDPQLIIDLQGCENLTESRDLLYTFGGIKRSMQVAILKQLGVR